MVIGKVMVVVVVLVVMVMLMVVVMAVAAVVVAMAIVMVVAVVDGCGDYGGGVGGCEGDGDGGGSGGVHDDCHGGVGDDNDIVIVMMAASVPIIKLTMVVECRRVSALGGRTRHEYRGDRTNKNSHMSL